MSTGWRVAWVSPLGLLLPAGYAQWRPHSMANAEKSPARHTRKPAPSARGDHLDGLAVDEGADIGDDVRIIDLVILDADIAEMRGEHHVVELAERMIDRQRLDVEHVEAGAADASGGQRRDQRLLVHDRPARRVDQISRRLHQGEGFFAERAPRAVAGVD